MRKTEMLRRRALLTVVPAVGTMAARAAADPAMKPMNP